MTAPRTAVYGTGSAGMRHLAALRALGARPVAVPLRASRRAELEAAGFETAAGLRDAAARGAAACVIATETGRHASDATTALGCGLDLLIEKPLSARAEQARGLLGEVEQRRRRAFVACVLRFSPSLSRFRARLPEAGTLHAVRVECRSYLPDWRPQRPYRDSYSARAEDGGVLRDLIHEIDYAGWLFGWPARVYGRLANMGRLGIASEERAELAWEIEGGPSVTVGLDYLTRTARRGIVAHGERGELRWDAVAQTTTWTAAGQTPETENCAAERDELFAAQARAFIESLSGRPDPRLATLADGLRAVALCDAARAASASGASQEVASP
ncbi:MAG: Gfo/Idh/MocA family oxidoreductase [Elusimicrobia bacterium]|nr:Gfo/Idh/MocA family oxidoreductase [Elusimicrobiota bacterium]